MNGLSKSDFRLLGLWSILLLLTLIALESVHLKGWMRDERLQGAAVISLAFIKVRLIILDFMEVRHAPRLLRFAMEAWVAVMCAALIALLFHTP
jgi:hypothetical protein